MIQIEKLSENHDMLVPCKDFTCLSSDAISTIWHWITGFYKTISKIRYLCPSLKKADDFS